MSHHCRPPAPYPRHKSRHPRTHRPCVGAGFCPARHTALLVPVRRGDPRGRPREGKSPKRRRWRKKRGDFEEVPRLAATTVAGNRLARRWAREPRPYAPPRNHCTGRTGSSAPTNLHNSPLQQLPQLRFYCVYFLAQFHFIHRKVRVFKAFYHHFIFDQHPPNHASGGFLCFCKPDVFLV